MPSRGEAPDPASGFLVLGSSRLEYRRAGPFPGPKPLVVLLHEGLGSARRWGAFPAALVSMMIEVRDEMHLRKAPGLETIDRMISDFRSQVEALDEATRDKRR